MKNYYEILEVNENASPEVIEKAYKTLAKKYHPDLQNGENQKKYAEKMKEINEAYEVLSNDFKKSSYDEQLKSKTVTEEEYQKVLQENLNLKQEIERTQYIQNNQYNINNQRNTNNTMNVGDNTIANMTRVLSDEINRARKQAYQDAYIQDLKNRGYKIKYKHTLKDYLKAIIVVIIIIFVMFLIYQIPPVKEFFTNLYEENMIFKAVVDIFKNTFSTEF